jgi:hypothetical protein
MSEYQYYEFASLDRQLTGAEMTELRAVSKRAVITPSSFINHYEWGDLKADPSDWMRRYFDAFVYTANWLSCRLALRVPVTMFDPAELAPFSVPNVLHIDAIDGHWIFDWFLDEGDNEQRFEMEDGCGWMARLSGLRDELLRGDMRSLYLGWLAGAARGMIGDEALEPEVPAGLAQLSAAQQALVEFLEIDPDMLTVAAAGSAEAFQDTTDAAATARWWDTWSRAEMVTLLELMLHGCGPQAERRIKARHAGWLKAQRPAVAGAVQRRSVADLRELASSAGHVRREREAVQRAEQAAEARRQREATLKRMMVDADRHWDDIDAQVQRGSGAGYEQAVRALAELAEGYALTATRDTFDRALRRFLVRHARRGALLRRLTEAGLWSGG